MGICLSIIAKANEEIASSVVKSIDIDRFSNITVIEDASANGVFLGGILLSGKAGKECGMKGVNNVAVIVNEEKNVINTGWCVFHIASARKEGALKLVENININILSSKINKEEDIEKSWWCVASIARVKKGVANEIINRLNPKLREEMQERMSRFSV